MRAIVFLIIVLTGFGQGHFVGLHLGEGTGLEYNYFFSRKINISGSIGIAGLFTETYTTEGYSNLIYYNGKGNPDLVYYIHGKFNYLFPVSKIFVGLSVGPELRYKNKLLLLWNDRLEKISTYNFGINLTIPVMYFINDKIFIKLEGGFYTELFYRLSKNVRISSATRRWRQVYLYGISLGYKLK